MLSLFNTQALCSPLCLTVDNSKPNVPELTRFSYFWTTTFGPIHKKIIPNDSTLRAMLELLEKSSWLTVLTK
jgi:hypothetical protein